MEYLESIFIQVQRKMEMAGGRSQWEWWGSCSAISCPPSQEARNFGGRKLRSLLFQLLFWGDYSQFNSTHRKKEVLSFDKSYRVVKGKKVKVEKEVKRRNDWWVTSFTASFFNSTHSDVNLMSLLYHWCWCWHTGEKTYTLQHRVKALIR